MIPLIKLLKIVLPVATVTTATIVTTSLISFSKKETDKDKENKDQILDDLELKAEEFKERTMLYSKDGTGDSVALSEEIKEEVMKLLKDNKDIADAPGLGEGNPDYEQLKKVIDSIKNKTAENDAVPKDNQKGDPKDKQSLEGESESPQGQIEKQEHDKLQDNEVNQEKTIDAKGPKVIDKEDNSEQDGLGEKGGKEINKDLETVKAQSSDIKNEDQKGDTKRELDNEKSTDSNLSGVNDEKDSEKIGSSDNDTVDDSDNGSDMQQLPEENQVAKQNLQNEEDRGQLKDVKDGQDISEQQQSKDQNLSLGDQNSLSHEDSTTNDAQVVSRNGETGLGSTEGKPKLSEDEIQKWEELFSEMTNLAGRLQTLSI